MFWMGGGGGQDTPAGVSCPPGVKIPRVGGEIPQGIFTPGGQVAQGVKINCYTSKMYHAFTFSWSPHAVPVCGIFVYMPK